MDQSAAFATLPDADATPTPSIRRLQAGPHPVLFSDRASLSPRTAIFVAPGHAASGAAWLDSPHLDCPTAVIGGASLNRLAEEPAASADALLAATGRRDGAGELLIFGYSLAGFAALLLGAAMAEMVPPARRVRAIAFSPPSRIWPLQGQPRHAPMKAALAALRADPVLAERLKRLGDAVPVLRAAAPRGNLEVTLVVGERNAHDRRAVDRLKGIPGVAFLRLPTAQHNTLFWLSTPLGNRAALEERLLAIGTGEPKSPEPDLALRRARREAAAMIRFRDGVTDLAGLLAAR